MRAPRGPSRRRMGPLSPLRGARGQERGGGSAFFRIRGDGPPRASRALPATRLELEGMGGDQRGSRFARWDGTRRPDGAVLGQLGQHSRNTLPGRGLRRGARVRLGVRPRVLTGVRIRAHIRPWLAGGRRAWAGGWHLLGVRLRRWGWSRMSRQVRATDGGRGRARGARCVTAPGRFDLGPGLASSRLRAREVPGMREAGRLRAIRDARGAPRTGVGPRVLAIRLDILPLPRGDGRGGGERGSRFTRWHGPRWPDGELLGQRCRNMRTCWGLRRGGRVRGGLRPWMRIGLRCPPRLRPWLAVGCRSWAGDWYPLGVHLRRRGWFHVSRQVLATDGARGRVRRVATRGGSRLPDPAMGGARGAARTEAGGRILAAILLACRSARPRRGLHRGERVRFGLRRLLYLRWWPAVGSRPWAGDRRRLRCTRLRRSWWSDVRRTVIATDSARGLGRHAGLADITGRPDLFNPVRRGARGAAREGSGAPLPDPLHASRGERMRAGLGSAFFHRMSWRRGLLIRGDGPARRGERGSHGGIRHGIRAAFGQARRDGFRRSPRRARRRTRRRTDRGRTWGGSLGVAIGLAAGDDTNRVSRGGRKRRALVVHRRRRRGRLGG